MSAEGEKIFQVRNCSANMNYGFWIVPETGIITAQLMKRFCDRGGSFKNLEFEQNGEMISASECKNCPLYDDSD